MELRLGSANPQTAATILDEMEGIARSRFVVSVGRPYVSTGAEKLETADHYLIIEKYDFVSGSQVEVSTTTLKVDGSLVWLSAASTNEDAYILLRDAVMRQCAKDGLPAPRLFETEDQDEEEDE